MMITNFRFKDPKKVNAFELNCNCIDKYYKLIE